MEWRHARTCAGVAFDEHVVAAHEHLQQCRLLRFVQTLEHRPNCNEDSQLEVPYIVLERCSSVA